MQDLKRPLAPYALVALGDLGEVKALPKVREGLSSRNDRTVLASIRAASRLLAAADGRSDDIRDQLAALLTDGDAAQELRVAALEALVKLKDKRLNRACPWWYATPAWRAAASSNAPQSYSGSGS